MSGHSEVRGSNCRFGIKGKTTYSIGMGGIILPKHRNIFQEFIEVGIHVAVPVEGPVDLTTWLVPVLALNQNGWIIVRETSLWPVSR